MAEEERAGCLTLFVVLLSCGYKCYVFLPHGAALWFVVCECGMFFHLLLEYLSRIPSEYQAV